MSDREGHQVNYYLPDLIFVRLEALKEYYGVDRLAALKQAITESYEKMLEKRAQETLIQQGMKIAADLATKEFPDRPGGKKPVPIVTEFEVRDRTREGTRKPSGHPGKKATG